MWRSLQLRKKEEVRRLHTGSFSQFSKVEREVGMEVNRG